MNYQIKLKDDQKEAIEYVLKKYLSEEKAEQAMKQVVDLYWPDDMDDDSGEPIDYGKEPEPIADRNYYPSSF